MLAKHIVGFLVAKFFKVWPQELRYGLAIRLTRIIAALVAQRRIAGPQTSRGIDSEREIALFLVLHNLTRHGVTLEPRMRVFNAEELATCVQDPNHGTLVVASHGLLNLLFVRYAHDAGYTPQIVAVEKLRILGTACKAQCIFPSQTFLLTVRRRLRDGGLVCAMIDRREPVTGRTSPLTIGDRQVHISDGLLRMAVHTNAHIVFVACCLGRDGAVEMMLARAPSEAHPSVLVASFSKFITRYAGTAAWSNGSHAD